MTNAQITINFFAAIDAKTKAEVLASIAKHYDITKNDALAEVVAEDAEHLLDYLVGSTRTAVLVLMQKHCLAA